MNLQRGQSVAQFCVPYSSWAIKIIARCGPSSRERAALQGLVMRGNIRVRI